MEENSAHKRLGSHCRRTSAKMGCVAQYQWTQALPPFGRHSNCRGVFKRPLFIPRRFASLSSFQYHCISTRSCVSSFALPDSIKPIWSSFTSIIIEKKSWEGFCLPFWTQRLNFKSTHYAASFKARGSTTANSTLLTDLNTSIQTAASLRHLGKQCTPNFHCSYLQSIPIPVGCIYLWIISFENRPIPTNTF